MLELHGARRLMVSAKRRMPRGHVRPALRLPGPAAVRAKQAEEEQQEQQPSPPPVDPAETARPAVRDFDSPAVAAMERRALRQIFDHLGLALTPAPAFAALEETRDPVTAFRRFAESVGVDPEAAQNRDRWAVARLVLATELLCELVPLRDLLSDAGKDAINDALGDAKGPEPLRRLLNHAEHVGAVAKLHRIGVRLNELQRCALAAGIQAIAAETAGDPLAIPRLEIESGIVTAERLEDALRAISVLRAEIGASLKLVRAARASGRLAEAHAAWCEEQGAVLERLIGEIETNDSLGVTAVEDRVRHIEMIRDGLLMVRGHAGDTDASPQNRRTPREDISAALAVLGLGSSPAPDWRMIERRCYAFRRQHNLDDPDQRATPELQEANVLRLLQVNNAMDVLGKYRDRLAELLADPAA